MNVKTPNISTPSRLPAKLEKKTLRLSNPALLSHEWPLLEITASEPGPTLCVMAGVHVNEVSSIEASLCLARTLPPVLMNGKISILPVVNLPALESRTEYNCPLDGKNLNWQFPGNPAGSFTDQLADALLNEWANAATVLVDLHGGDLRECIANFVMYQQTGDPELDRQNRALAECFDVQFVEPLRPELMKESGRACTGRGTQRRMAVMSECGSNGVVDPAAVKVHHDGVLRVAHLLGMTEAPPPPILQTALTVQNRVGLSAPKSGFFCSPIEVADYVEYGQKIGDIRSYHDETIAEIVAPVTGLALFILTHPIVIEGEHIMSIVTPVADA